MSWDPDQYSRFSAQRDRPALDLLVRLPAELAPKTIWDLGCGLGEQAALLSRRFPGAQVHGLDSSAEMLARARLLPDPVDWVQADLTTWSTPEPADLIFSNAALQWTSDHPTLFPRLADMLPPGGVLAVQMPVVDDAGWRGVLREVVEQGPWASRLSPVQRGATLPLEAYDELLRPLCGELDLWATTYLYVLEGEDALLEWVKGASASPYLAALADDQEREAFLARLREPFRGLHPRRADGTTLLPFPRLFILARRR